MIGCPSCGAENPEWFNFCGHCAASLSAPSSIAEERKTVTTLFCDLVAFTAMSEAADPEDVDRILGDYFARATKVIESHGGTVEKFIGDAVVGVFGVPAAHEDDPERAVRAALRILEALEGMTRPDGTPLEARCGVNTGQALVRLDVDPASGRGFLTGDAVNVAARLEAAALPGGVCVGALTYELTERVIEYEVLPPVLAKGKQEPVDAWRALQPFARTGSDPSRLNSTGLVGRDVELTHVCGVLDRVVATSLPQLMLVVGEPGIGKSRLVAELASYADAGPTLVTWRQGRCLPYGEGLALMPLVEIVKAHAGVLETDDRASLRDKVERILPEGPDRAWLRHRLLALLGEDAPKASTEENFAAWSQFFEHLAAREPLILVFEDLHWADETLLAFIESLIQGAADVPILVVGTARPELFDSHPGFAAAVRSAGRINLAPLREADMERLVLELLHVWGPPRNATGPMTGDVPFAILERSAGNPYFAEESARLFRDRGSLTDLPDTVQALIAARLDTLNADAKAVLSDCAVIGMTFWDGATAAVGNREPNEVVVALRELVAKQFVRRLRSTTMEGESEYVFWHALTRDVAYRQMPRIARARRHTAAAAWIETSAGDRTEELAEIIAHHYVTAHDLAVAARDDALASSTLDPAVKYLVKAGHRMLRSDLPAARRLYGLAHDLVPAGYPLRPQVLLGLCGIEQADLHMREAVALAEEIIPALRAAGDVSGTAEALSRAGACRVYLGAEEGGAHAEALALLEQEAPSPELVEALTGQASWHHLMMAGQLETTVSLCDRAIAAAGALALPTPVGASSFRALARLELGVDTALEEYEAAIDDSLAQGVKDDAALLLYNHCTAVLVVRGAVPACQAVVHGATFAEETGMRWFIAPFRMLRIAMLTCSGAWDDALSEEGVVESELAEAGSVQDLLELDCWLAAIPARRGNTALARSYAERIVDRASRIVPVPYNRDMARLAAFSAFGYAEAPSALRSEVQAWAQGPPTAGDPGFVTFVPDVVRAAVAGGDLALADEACNNLRPAQPMHRSVIAAGHARVAEARDELEVAATGFAEAAAGWSRLTVPYEEAQALLGRGRCLVALGRGDEAREPLAAAREIFGRLGAKPALAETDDLLRSVAHS